VWRWQERFMQAGYDGLLRDKTRPSRILPLGVDIAERVVMLTQTNPLPKRPIGPATMTAKAGLQPHRVRQFTIRCGQNYSMTATDSGVSR
jgi:hypothetical protein